MALPPEELVARYRAMKARGTPFTLRRSAIHGWGLFARRTFESGEMMVEYLGETIGNAVGDAREAFYEEVGIKWSAREDTAPISLHIQHMHLQRSLNLQI